MVESCSTRKRKLSEVESADQAQTRVSKPLNIDQASASQHPQECCKDSTSNPLTESNLKELDKINNEYENRAKTESHMSGTVDVRSLYQVARQGGLDLTELKGVRWSKIRTSNLTNC